MKELSESQLGVSKVTDPALDSAWLCPASSSSAVWTGQRLAPHRATPCPGHGRREQSDGPGERAAASTPSVCPKTVASTKKSPSSGAGTETSQADCFLLEPVLTRLPLPSSPEARSPTTLLEDAGAVPTLLSIQGGSKSKNPSLKLSPRLAKVERQRRQPRAEPRILSGKAPDTQLQRSPAGLRALPVAGESARAQPPPPAPRANLSRKGARSEAPLGQRGRGHRHPHASRSPLVAGSRGPKSAQAV